MRSVVILLFLLVCATGTAGAQTLDDRVYAIARQLMCPVCAGQTVAESDATLAREMRTIIRQKLIEGATPEEILQYFISQFGEGVLAEPPRRGIGTLLYAGPALALLLGLGIAAVYIRRWAAPGRARRPSEQVGSPPRAG